ncbi:MAG TPA: hypothetical protein VG425_03520 [Casimicrobiaceae bacterium]|jgi:hypothetical protein|nr:hypothetical protein [Casimicrobiaceae bacterium]
MNWISKSLGFGRGEAFDRAAETNIGGTPYDARLAIQDSLIRGTPNAPDDHTAEEIKRRQVSLALRYLMAVRAR